MVREPSFLTAVAAVPVTCVRLGVASLLRLTPCWALTVRVAPVVAAPT